MSGHGRYLAGIRSTPVRVVCVDCGEEWDGTARQEEGTGWLEPREDCAKCGSTALDATELDEIDIAERKLEARGEDF